MLLKMCFASHLRAKMCSSSAIHGGLEAGIGICYDDHADIYMVMMIMQIILLVLPAKQQAGVHSNGFISGKQFYIADGKRALKCEESS